jgi:hypothetical protein
MKPFLALALLAAASTAYAQGPVYKLRQPDGRTVYSDTVPADTEVRKELRPQRELNVAAPLAPRQEARQADARARAQLGRIDELWRERNLAQGELDAARRALADGAEPLPGERTANATGRSRLNAAYWERQGALERAVERAERRLERAEQAFREAAD